MEKQYITQCPQCDTAFKVSLAQMNKAQGLVRCGECMHVFSADQHLVSQQTRTAVKNKPPEPKSSIPEIPLQIRQVDPKKPLFSRLIWGSLLMIASAGLAAQVFWFERDSLSQHPHLGPLYQQLCQPIDCQLGARQDLPQITNHQLVVRDHPKYLGALAVDILMENQAPFAQPFPAVQLLFTDLNGEPKAARNIQPNEYLGGDFQHQTLMPSRKPVQIQIEIIEPGAQASSYRLQFVAATNDR